MELMEKVLLQIEKHHMLQKGDGVLLGVSGGADSMCLLQVMMSLRKILGLRLAVVHIHHGIRGKEADEDAEFVENECKKNGIPCEVIYADVPKLKSETGWSMEEAGRNARYQAFDEVAKKYGISKIAVAHNREDYAETMLFHAFRGCGLHGLCGIPATRDRIIRPLLSVSRQEIEQYLAKLGVSWRTDSTNASGEYARNRIRHEILPVAVEGINAEAVEHLVKLGEELSEADAYLEEETERVCQMCVCRKDGEIQASIRSLNSVSGVIRKRLWLRVCYRISGRQDVFSRAHIEAIEDLCGGQTGKYLMLPGGVEVRKNYDTLIFSKRRTEEKEADSNRLREAANGHSCEITEFPCTIPIPGGKLKLSILERDSSRMEKSVEIPKNNYTKWFDYDKIEQALTVRKRQTGDYLVIHPTGQKKSLKALLIDAKLAREDRDNLRVLAAGNRVLWCIGVRAENGLYVTENTKRILVAEWREEG